jgi:beta-N-acetylhexosaminidase
MLDLRGISLEKEERDLLVEPVVGGVILFSRNYDNPQQITELCEEIHSLRTPPLLIAVDQEGGRVQRFRGAFTGLPPCSRYGQLYDDDSITGLEVVEQAGWLMATELRSVGVDFSFAPVLDIDKGISQVIGDRAFHRKPDMVTALARNFIRGMNRAGMSAVGKHYPGHGAVKQDSHHEIPFDNRRYEDIFMEDLIPFERLVKTVLAGIMPAHVIYPNIDQQPAGYSKKWIHDILREEFQFQGVVFSDDLSMEGAGIIPGFVERAETAIDAGCDMILVCNNRNAVNEVISGLNYKPNPVAQTRLMRMHGRGKPASFDLLNNDNEWNTVSKRITKLNTMPELDLGDDSIPS